MSTTPKTEAGRALVTNSASAHGMSDQTRAYFANAVAKVETAAVDAYLQSDEFEKVLAEKLERHFPIYGYPESGAYPDDDAKAIAQSIRDSRQ